MPDVHIVREITFLLDFIIRQGLFKCILRTRER